jgi:hypothetical protein
MGRPRKCPLSTEFKNKEEDEERAPEIGMGTLLETSRDKA